MARRAERAVERAARLRRDAQRAAGRLGNEHRLDGLTRADVQEPLARAVGGMLLLEHRRQVGVAIAASSLRSAALKSVIASKSVTWRW